MVSRQKHGEGGWQQQGHAALIIIFVAHKFGFTHSIILSVFYSVRATVIHRKDATDHHQLTTS